MKDHGDPLENIDIEKTKSFIVVEIIEYVPNAVVIKTIVRQATGDVTAVSIDTGEGLMEKLFPFDTFIQVMIEGTAEVIIDHLSTIMIVGQATIIPTHSRSAIKANSRFKMISTVIESGYDVSLSFP